VSGSFACGFQTDLHLADVGGIVNRNVLDVDFGERHTMPETANEVLRWVAQYTKPTNIVQRVCDHPAQINLLQKQITDLQTQQFLLPQCNHAEIEKRIRGLGTDLAEARM